ncbi:hypothetical protein ABQF26_01655 [Mycolicibacterium elephantis]
MTEMAETEPIGTASIADAVGVVVDDVVILRDELSSDIGLRLSNEGSPIIILDRELAISVAEAMLTATATTPRPRAVTPAKWGRS